MQCAIEEIDKSRCVSYFSTVPKAHSHFIHKKGTSYVKEKTILKTRHSTKELLEQ